MNDPFLESIFDISHERLHLCRPARVMEIPTVFVFPGRTHVIPGLSSAPSPLSLQSVRLQLAQRAVPQSALIYRRSLDIVGALPAECVSALFQTVVSEVRRDDGPGLRAPVTNSLHVVPKLGLLGFSGLGIAAAVHLPRVKSLVGSMVAEETELEVHMEKPKVLGVVIVGDSIGNAAFEHVG